MINPSRSAPRQRGQPLHPGSDSDSGRTAEIHRVTGETNVRVNLGLDGSGSCQVATGVPFLDHKLHQISSHGLIDLEIQATGDTHIDDHHTKIIPEGFGRALEVSAYSLAPLCRYAKPLFTPAPA
jgi:imidazoleglycerol phosphate dehydratase HisB